MPFKYIWFLEGPERKGNVVREQCEKDEGTVKGAMGGGRWVSRRMKKEWRRERERAGSETDRRR